MWKSECPLFTFAYPGGFHTEPLTAGPDGTIEHHFSKFIPQEVYIYASTPSAAWWSQTWVKFHIVPHPVGITHTQKTNEAYIDVGEYGTNFIHELVPSAGATGDDLYNNRDRFEIKEEVLCGYCPFGNYTLHAGSKFDVEPSGYMHKDHVAFGGYVEPDGTLRAIDLNDYLPALSMPQTDTT
jgi:hypothetical protein